MTILSFRSQALWILGYPEAALADTHHALKDAREIGQAAALMYALTSWIFDSSLAETTRQQTRMLDELLVLADERVPRSGRRGE